MAAELPSDLNAASSDVNHFLTLVAKAQRRGWCLRPRCSTCAATEFREAVSEDVERLAEDLAGLDLDVVQGVPEWDGAMRLALDALPSADLMDHVLAAWLPRLDSHVRVADLVLFYYVRQGALFGPMSVEVLKRWTDRCIDIACNTSDPSLLESLIYTVGDELAKRPALIPVLRAATERSRKVALAVERTGTELGT